MGSTRYVSIVIAIYSSSLNSIIFIKIEVFEALLDTFKLQMLVFGLRGQNGLSGHTFVMMQQDTWIDNVMEPNLCLPCQVDILLMLLLKHLNTEVNENVKVLLGRTDNEPSHIVIVSRL